jgi:hypothetical protein
MTYDDDSDRGAKFADLAQWSTLSIVHTCFGNFASLLTPKGSAISFGFRILAQNGEFLLFSPNQTGVPPTISL